MAKLLEANKKALYLRLDSVIKTKSGLLLCNDVINVLSDAKERDRRVIGNFNNDEVVTRNIRLNGVLKKCRFFTEAGIKRYVCDGKLFNRKNACEYFNVVFIDDETKQLERLCVNNTFIKCRIVKYLFEKRKRVTLNDTVTKDELITWVTEYSDSDIIESKKNRLLEWLYKH